MVRAGAIRTVFLWVSLAYMPFFKSSTEIWCPSSLGDSYISNAVSNPRPRTSLILSGNSDFTLSNDIILPNDISLSQNYPNPFNPETQINFSISNPSNISLQVYDLNGVLVDKIIDNEYYNPGKFSISYSPQLLSSGVYFYKLNDGSQTITNKMIYLK